MLEIHNVERGMEWQCASFNRLLTSNARQNCSLLNGGWLLETVSVDASEELLFQVHVVETGDHLVPVTFDHTIWVHASGGVLVLLLLSVFRTISVAVAMNREREREREREIEKISKLVQKAVPWLSDHMN